MSTTAAGIGRAAARYPDSTGRPALYDVLAVRGFGAQRRVYLRYVGHADGDGKLVRDPDAVPSAGPYWVSAARFHVTILPRFETDVTL